MSENPPESSTKNSADGRKKKNGRTIKGLPFGPVGTGLTIAGLAVALTAGGLYLGRRTVAEEVLVGWLHRRGIQADVNIERIEWDGFTGRITVGNPDDPDVRIDRVEVDYLIGLPWMKDGLGLTPRRVLLSQPVIKAEWTGKVLSFGSLDPLIEEFTSKPPSKKPGPVIVVDKGRALLMTPYGRLTALADARLNDARLEWLKASLVPANLTLEDMRAVGLAAEIEASSTDKALLFEGRTLAASLVGEGFTGTDADFTFKGQIPYPAKSVKQAQGPVTLDGQLSLARLDGEQATGRDIKADIDWNGEIKGWIEAFDMGGRLNLDARASKLLVAGQDMSGVALVTDRAALTVQRGRLEEDANRVRWKLEGPARLQAATLASGDMRARQLQLVSGRLRAGGIGSQMEANGQLIASADRFDTGDLGLQRARGQFVLDLRRGLETRIALDGSLSARGHYSGLGAVKADDAPELVRLKQAASDFSLSATSVSFVQNNRGTGLQVSAPVQLRSANGADIRLTPLDGPLMQIAGGQVSGAARLDVSGEGFPQLGLDVSRWQIADGGISARLSGKGSMDFTPVQSIALESSGRLDIRNGQTQYFADGCAALQARQIDIGENRLDDLATGLCADGKPLFTAGQGGWQLAGEMRDTRLRADFLQLALDQGRGHLLVNGTPGGLGLRLSGIDARVSDTTVELARLAPNEDPPVLRVNPLMARGDIGLANGRWTGALDLLRDRYKVATLGLLHDNASQSGSLKVTTPRLNFTAGGLQPGAVSPMLAGFMYEVSGDPVSLDGEIGWTATGSSSRGTLLIGDGQPQGGEGLSFMTPMGRLTSLRGKLHLSDLLNPTAELQELTVTRLDTVVPVEDVRVQVGLGDGMVRLSQAELKMADGSLSVRDVTLPLNGSGNVEGTLEVSNLQVNDLLVAAKLQDKAMLDAHVNGRLQFRYNREIGWDLHSIYMNAQGGRLSIQPEVLSGVSSNEGDILGGELPVPVEKSAIEGLAYQALEALAIRDLDAKVYTICTSPEDTREGICKYEDGKMLRRLAIDFRINGYHAPAEHKELRLSVFDLLNGSYLNRPLVLPSDTPVILNLGTTWNADQLATSLYQMMQRRYEDMRTMDTGDVSSAR